jgi:hypothetical protein
MQVVHASQLARRPVAAQRLAGCARHVLGCMLTLREVPLADATTCLIGEGRSVRLGRSKRRCGTPQICVTFAVN